MSHRIAVALVFGAALMGGATAEAQSFRRITRARTVQAEDSLHVQVQFAGGTLRISPAEARTLYQGEIYYDHEKFGALIVYDPEARRLSFGVDAASGRFTTGKLETPQRLTLMVTPSVPTTFDIELGAADAQIELGDLTMQSATIQSGAAKARVSFTQANRTKCHTLALSAGVAEFAAESLGNARCELITFGGGVGDVLLDLSGDWSHGLTEKIDVQLGLGQLTLRLPQNVGIAIDIDRFLASFDETGLEKRGGRYVSPNFESAAVTLHLALQAAFGDIDIEWVEGT